MKEEHSYLSQNELEAHIAQAKHLRAEAVSSMIARFVSIPGALLRKITETSSSFTARRRTAAR